MNYYYNEDVIEGTVGSDAGSQLRDGLTAWAPIVDN